MDSLTNIAAPHTDTQVRSNLQPQFRSTAVAEFRFATVN